MKVPILVVLGLITMGCASVKFPVYDAESTECMYISKGDDIEWECEIKGSGERKELF